MIKSSPKTREKRQRESSAVKLAVESAQIRDSKSPVNGRCIACLSEIPLPNGRSGSGRISEYNHCVPRSRIHGEHNWQLLHSVENLAGACREHHQAYDCMPEFWLPLMVKWHGYEYTDKMFKYYVETPHPLVAKLKEE